MAENKVAAFLKAFAVVGAICGMLPALITLDIFLIVECVLASIAAGVLLYGLGEAIELLHQIREELRCRRMTGEEPAPADASPGCERIIDRPGPHGKCGGRVFVLLQKFFKKRKNRPRNGAGGHCAGGKMRLY